MNNTLSPKDNKLDEDESDTNITDDSSSEFDDN